jgi:hypothetical protein
LSDAVHAWQRPSHAWSQHTPSLQNPLMHWLAAVHAAPFVWSALQVPVPASQYAVATHVASLAQVVAQVLTSAQL